MTIMKGLGTMAAVLALVFLTGFSQDATAGSVKPPGEFAGMKRFDKDSGRGRGGKWRRYGYRSGTGTGDISVTYFYHVRPENSIEDYWSDQLPKMLERYAGGTYETVSDTGFVESNGVHTRTMVLNINGNNRTVFFAWAYVDGQFRSAYVRAKGTEDAHEQASATAASDLTSGN